MEEKSRSSRRKKLKVNDRLIISLDVNRKSDVFSLCRRIDGRVSILKIGLELIYNVGLDAISIVKSFGYKVLLDAKLLDIPNTVLKATSGIVNLGVDIVTIHTLGGEKMLNDTVAFLNKKVALAKSILPPLLFGVTVLTSLDDQDLNDIGLKSDYLSLVSNLTNIAKRAGLDGVICSPGEVKMLREKYGGDFYIATPGIRLPEDTLDDQKRVSTPQEAISNGADFIIVGRSITAKKNIEEAIDKFLEKIASVV